MKFNSDLKFECHPKFDLHADIQPIAFRAATHGKLQARVSAIRGRIGQVPLELVIPFHKHGPVLIGRLGTIPFGIDAFEIAFDDARAALEGVLGTEGVHGHVKGSMDNCATAQVDGKCSGKVASVDISLQGDE